MTFAPGTRLGPYEVLAPIGTGGMGVVYRARDPRLQRDVAIKVIRHRPNVDVERLIRRLELEARAVAQLSHPNIVAVHDVGKHEGAPFLVMEFLVGDTLRQRLADGPLPVRQATDLVIQIAEGLAAAHAHGLCHRDLKPENVILTQDGRVKILDFGLVKPAGTAGDPGDEETASLPSMESLTEDGMVMGTVGYLSPEQVRGHRADARSDIFALGTMFYEMLVGRRPFPGQNAVEIMSAILREEVTFPPAPEVPPALAHLVRTCLEKEPRARFQNASDLTHALQAVGAQGAASHPAALLVPRWWRSTAVRRWSLPLAVALAAVATLPFLARWLAARTGAGHTHAEWTALSFKPGLTATARFAPDGETVVYAHSVGEEAPRIYSLRVGQVLPRPLGMTGQVMGVGRDGSILFVQSAQRVHPGAAALGTLSEFLVDGTEAKPLVEQAEAGDRGAGGSPLVAIRVAAGTGGRRNHLECPPGRSLYESSGWLYCPRVSPDGTRIAVLESQGPDSWVARLRVLDLQGKTLFLSPVNDIQSQAWAPDGRELLITRPAGTIDAMDLQGRVRPVLRGPHQLHLFDVTAGGRMLLASFRDLTEVYLDVPGSPVRTLPMSAWAVQLAADGGQLLFTGPGPNDENMTYLLREGPDSIRPIALGRVLGANADASVALLKRRKELVRVPVGPGSEFPVPLGELGTVWRATFLPDGRRIAVVAAEPGKDFHLHVIDPKLGRRQTLPGSEGMRWVVAVDAEEVVGDALDGYLYRHRLDGRPPERLAGCRPGDLPLRAGTAHQLFVQEAHTEPGRLRVCSIDLRTGERRPWRTLAYPVGPGQRLARVMSITPDGRRIAYFSWSQPSDLFAVDGVLGPVRPR